MNRIAPFLRRMGGKLGLTVSLIGFVLIFFGWNGAASFNFVPQQVPYLISGGLAGLGLIMLGAAFLVVESNRTERAELQATLLEIRDGLERVTATSGTIAASMPTPEAGMVVAGSASYHKPSCHLVAGRDELEVLTLPEAEERGLAACRVCDPSSAAGASAGNGASRRQLKARS